MIKPAETSVRYAIAVDIGGSHLRTCLVDSEGGLSHLRRESTPGNKQEILSTADRMIRELERELEGKRILVGGIGVSSGGRVDPRQGIVIESTGLLPDWQDIPLRRALSGTRKLRVEIENDGNCAALAELRFGAGMGFKDFVVLILGTGIGGGVVVNGEIVRGARNAAGELGHIVIDRNGPACSCGAHGCVEAFASGWGLSARARGAMGGILDAEQLGAKAKQGDQVARRIIEDGGRALGTAIVSLLHILNPQRVILSGPLLRLGSTYTNAVRSSIEESAMPLARGSAELIISTLEEPSLLGAGLLIFG